MVEGRGPPDLIGPLSYGVLQDGRKIFGFVIFRNLVGLGTTHTSKRRLEEVDDFYL